MARTDSVAADQLRLMQQSGEVHQVLTQHRESGGGKVGEGMDSKHRSHREFHRCDLCHSETGSIEIIPIFLC